MSIASPFRRSAGLLAATTVVVSTTVLLGPGTAQAVGSGWVFSSDEVSSVEVPPGTCAIDWQIIGGPGGMDVGEGAVEPAYETPVRTPGAAVDPFTLAPGGAGANATTGPSAGGVNASGNGAYDGEDGNLSDQGGGGGGAASVVLWVEDNPVYLSAAGGPGAGTDGGAGGTSPDFDSAAHLEGEHPDEHFGPTSTHLPEGRISGVGIA